jgi:predicted nucleic acid-binding protein
VRGQLAERRALVVDASAIGRWFIKNPPFLDKTNQLQSDFDEGKFTLVAPENMIHEVTGAIHHAIVAGRLSPQSGLALLDRLLDLDATIVETDDLVRPAFELSLRYGCSYYDAIYLEIARRHNYPFVHADGNLKRALAGRFPLEIWIEDYLTG